MLVRRALLDKGTSIEISCMFSTFLGTGGGWPTANSRSIKTDLITFAGTGLSTTWVPSIQVCREAM
jgi:hypothetical protein